jgi:hypothetical protein
LHFVDEIPVASGIDGQPAEDRWDRGVGRRNQHKPLFHRRDASFEQSEHLLGLELRASAGRSMVSTSIHRARE